MIKTLNFDNEKYDFAKIIGKWFGVKDLSKLHTFKTYEHFTRENDQSTIWHKTFYDKVRQDRSFDSLYTSFLKSEVKPRFNETIVYQKIPTFRVHLPGNISVGEYHKDKHYRDESWAIKVKELNYYLPLTDAYGTNTIWAETEEDKGDFIPFTCEYGDLVEWDASNLLHGNKTNTTPDTRVSFDFRIIPKSRYIDSDHLTINTKIPFGIGGYYDTL